MSSRDTSPRGEDSAYREDSNDMRHVNSPLYNDQKETAVYQNEDITVYKETEGDDDVYEDENSADYREDEDSIAQEGGASKYILYIFVFVFFQNRPYLSEGDQCYNFRDLHKALKTIP